ncbi:hypothetical protein NK553_08155 [Pseudomonas sp. ZM23]|uniref:SecDF P1 head subdomain domain-containing protein n=1 Tax=Pseudomonas triclosanedens TaxID=2961893 RepID=A0ABY7A021_9PSED|nr:hypothetical protein [Pseudomonas triclosanedens]MCP8463913.1 hypothetical protein [Pseudomonas triclosanedens]MCP8468997.1 hypothetical protein [Pseudomonas triclosanedens]MCP8475719.1 hypothetical protein [Pseudomonas triclosanedens]WAI50569.1 hypothetical protein OU419_04695 [Pseudomonas triclosanedens]
MKPSIPLLLAALLSACAGGPVAPPQHSFDVHALAERPSASTRTLADPQGQAVLVATRPELTQRDVQRAELASVAGGEPAVQVQFSPDASQRLARLTRAEQGKALAVVIDGQLKLMPKVDRPVDDGRVLLTGFASRQEAETLVRQLNALRNKPVQPEQKSGGQP